MSADVKRALSVVVEIEAVEFKGISNATDGINWILGNGGTARYHEESRVEPIVIRNPGDGALAFPTVTPEELQVETRLGNMRALVDDWDTLDKNGAFRVFRKFPFARKYEIQQED